MVAGGGDGADAVETSWQTSGEVCGESALTIASIIDTLEEGKGFRVESICGICLAVEVLNRDVSMANDRAALQSLRGGVIGVVRIGERPSLQVRDLHRESDW